MKTGSNNYKGLNTDVGYDAIKDFYIDALDIRITTDKGESMGSITNIKGNKKFFELPIESNTSGTPEVIGATSIRDTIVLLVADDSEVNSWIYTLEYDESDKSFVSLDLKYTDELNFNKKYPIEVVGRYESPAIQRIYWTDYNEYLRSLNLEDPDLGNLPPGLLDVFPNMEYKEPKLTNVFGGGKLPVGLYQYGYRVITQDGKKSLISPLSAQIHCVESSETLSQSRRYVGNIEGTITNKSHEITINTSDYSNFKDIELIVLIKESPNTTGNAYFIEKKGINNQSEVVFTHTGDENTIVPLEIFEVINKQYPFKTSKSLVAKDNALIVANIKSGEFSVQELLPSGESFDAKTKRFNRTGGEDTTLGGNTPEEIALNKAFNINYNKDAHWDTDWHVNQQYKYQSNGTTLGGNGPNIDYKFHLEPFVIDGDVQASIANLSNIPQNSIDLGDGYVYNDNNTYDNTASPFKSGLLKGYKRGETYRFGIVFYNKKGEASFVEYIGDIKFPDISDETDENTTGPTFDQKYFPLARETQRNTPDFITTTAYALGIEFTIDFTSCPTLLDKIEGFQIVRVKREQADIRRLCSGIMKVGAKMATGTAEAPDFDLRGPGGAENIIHPFPYHQERDLIDGSTVGTGYGWNGNFYALNNNKINTAPWTVYGGFLTYHSPEISYNDLDTIGEINNNAMLLMTGRYGQYYSSLDPADPLASGSGYETMLNNTAVDFYSYSLVEKTDTKSLEQLGYLTDHRRKLRSTGKVNKTDAVGSYNQYERGIEYIRKWEDVSPVIFDNGGYEDSDINQKLQLSIGPYTGLDNGGNGIDLYFRNFSIYSSGYALNEDKGTSPNSINKGPSGIIGSMVSVDTDPLENTSLTIVAPGPHFRTTDSFADPFVKSEPDSIGPLSGTVKEQDLISTPILDTVLAKTEVYGGYTYDALENNSFIPASPVIDKSIISGNSHTFRVLRGDIFITMWTFQSMTACLGQRFYPPSSGTKEEAFGYNLTETTIIPIESTINTEIDHGANTKRGVSKDVPGGSGGSNEPRWRQETDNTDTTYGNSLNMYAYNKAYSLESDDLKFFVKPKALGENESKTNDIRAYISNVKFNNEELDSWTNFGINNFYDVDDYGPINKILAFNESIFFIQDKAVGRYAINTRVSIPTGDGIPLELGTGQGIQDHKYLSNKSGSIHQWGIKETQSGIYYWDSINRKINMITNQSQPISEIKGIHSLVSHFEGDINLRKENEGDNPLLGKGVHIVRDSINNEVLFTFLGIGKGDLVKNITLVYDEVAQQFTSKYSATPNLYIENGDILLSNNPTNKKELFQHNVGNWGEFYGNTTEASITLVLNANAPINKILRTVEFNSIVRDDNKVIERQQTITGFKIENEYQTTGKIDFSSGRIKRKFDKWRLKIPRDQNAGNNRNRLRSSYFKLTLYFDNTYNKELILNRILYYYDIQIF